MSQTPKAKKETKSAGTQTSKTNTVLEIANLQEQVKLLTIEVQHLRKYIFETPETVKKSRTPSPVNINNVDEFNQTVQNQSAWKKNTKIIQHGCSCKTKCSSKICGCVKKNIQCTEWCKCNNNICVNQKHENIDQNKENLEYNELTQKNIEKPQKENKHILNVNVHKSLFSPDVTMQETEPNVERFRSTSVYFGNPKRLTFQTSDDEQQPKDKDRKSKNKTTQKKKNSIRKNNLKVNNSETNQRHRSTSNKDIRRLDNIKIEKYALRKCISSDIQTNEEFKQISKCKINYVQNIKHGMVSLRRPQQRSKKVEEIATSSTIDSKEETDSPSIENNTEEMIKNKSLDIHQDTNDDFDPMKPKRELARTPVRDNSIETVLCNTIDKSLATSIISTEEEPVIPAEFNYAQVDWEKYQAQLIACNKCHRKFHPFRIKKHESCCKKM
ncbi:uncharacterized protein LOC100747134 isoform X1 [Bombus impatiens]|uniref:Uncharacterized protein LOC100747134 isoform X1 n=1 Tax=Bombus impatiens TaxID=132113 RepID=A0A6P8LWL3_BOMIM|nr:uncharacterized protein LOC100747134 isoform X1 [Bombus impatiens]XP_033177661.1 uncharacterized protein LOC100747134 isoform X1 [Bombus impatiens]XP_033177662.1 uncharacterized protein LOC100747134 isoform X1 [Bombus impatiens]